MVQLFRRPTRRKQNLLHYLGKLNIPPPGKCCVTKKPQQLNIAIIRTLEPEADEVAALTD